MTPCDLWPGATTRDGYGRHRVQGRHVYVHVEAWEAIHGPKPAGLELDHLCRVPPCRNVAHLELVTHRENVLRGENPAAWKARQTHCYRGHPLSGENLKIDHHGHRQCRTCIQRRSRARSRDKTLA